MIRKAHIFNIDNLIFEIDQKVWIIERSNPNECIMRIPKEDFDLIRSGAFRKDNLSMKFGSSVYYLSPEIFDTLSKRVKKLSNTEDLTFSFREYTDPECIQDLDIEYNFDCIEHLKNVNDDVYFITTKGTDRKYGHYFNKLIDTLKEKYGIIVNQVYYLNQSFFSQNKDMNIKKIIYTILSNLVGRGIENDKLTEDLDREYDEIYYYDSNYVTINKIKEQINPFLVKILDTSIKKKRLYLNLVGSNKLNPIKEIPVELGKKYIRNSEFFGIGK